MNSSAGPTEEHYCNLTSAVRERQHQERPWRLVMRWMIPIPWPTNFWHYLPLAGNSSFNTKHHGPRSGCSCHGSTTEQDRNDWKGGEQHFHFLRSLWSGGPYHPTGDLSAPVRVARTSEKPDTNIATLFYWLANVLNRNYSSNIVLLPLYSTKCESCFEIRATSFGLGWSVLRGRKWLHYQNSYLHSVKCIHDSVKCVPS